MLTVRQVKVDALNNSPEMQLKVLCKKLKCSAQMIKNYKIIHEAIDARNKNQVFYVYEMQVETFNDQLFLNGTLENDILLFKEKKYEFPHLGSQPLKNRPVVVGSGPAGLFAAYMLALNGYKPIVFERGEQIEKRIDTVNHFWQTGQLNEKSNVQFGEGGAGTFSDGKLNTRVNDGFFRNHMVLETFVKFGAPPEILYSNKPHIGTDKLIEVVRNMRNEIISLGGTFYFESLLTDIIIEDGQLVGIKINNEKTIDCDVCVLAIGHSARDTFKMLLSRNVTLKNKPFAVGIRVQHSQDVINESQYGNKYKNILPNASYKLTYKSSNCRGVYSFCMCPGGYVVNASSVKGQLAINGMSYYARESKNANSAIVVTVNEKDYGTHPLAGMFFQEKLEKLAYQKGQGNIPVQLLKDYYADVLSSEYKSVPPIFKGDISFANINEILPKDINVALKEAFPYFGHKIKGFDSDDALIAGVESRTSSPISIPRDQTYESNIKGLYPCGEGAGYAGGITSSAMDGIKVAEQIAIKYQNFI